MKLELATDVIGVALPRFVRHLDLFSGIGGFALAAQWVGGIETVAFCEIDPACKDIARLCFVSHDPSIRIQVDAETLPVAEFPDARAPKPVHSSESLSTESCVLSPAFCVLGNTFDDWPELRPLYRCLSTKAANALRAAGYMTPQAAREDFLRGLARMPANPAPTGLELSPTNRQPLSMPHWSARLTAMYSTATRTASRAEDGCNHVKE